MKLMLTDNEYDSLIENGKKWIWWPRGKWKEIQGIRDVLCKRNTPSRGGQGEIVHEVCGAHIVTRQKMGKWGHVRLLLEIDKKE